MTKNKYQIVHTGGWYNPFSNFSNLFGNFFGVFFGKFNGFFNNFSFSTYNPFQKTSFLSKAKDTISKTKEKITDDLNTLNAKVENYTEKVKELAKGGGGKKKEKQTKQRKKKEKRKKTKRRKQTKQRKKTKRRKQTKQTKQRKKTKRRK